MIEPKPVIWESGQLTIYTHGVFFALGALVGITVLILLAFKHKLSILNAIEIAAWPFIVGILAARLGFVLVYYSYFSTWPQMFAFWSGGLLSYSGIIGALITAWLLIRKFDPKRMKIWMQVFLVAAAFAWSVGRWGNFFAGDSYGVSSDKFSWAYGHVPIQIFESIYVLSLAIFSAWFVSLKKKNQLVDTIFVPLFFAVYAFGRLIIDYWRDEKVILWSLKYSQVFCLAYLILFAIGFVYCYLLYVKKIHPYRWLRSIIPVTRSKS